MTIRMIVAAAVLAVGTGLVSAQTPESQPATAPASDSPFKTDIQRMSYALGLQFGDRLKGIDVDTSALAQGIKDAAGGVAPQMTEKEIEASLDILMQKIRAQQLAAMSAEAAANQKAGDAFLAENAKKEGVKTTASGLQYKVLKSGSGKSPKATDNVSVNYRGTLTNGKEFDASRGSPVSFPLNRVIPGWTEGLQLMKEGDKFQFFIPAKLAYGEDSPSPDIGPNSVLVFEVELLKVN